VSTSPLRPEDTPFGPPTKLCVRVKFTEIINCAKFHFRWLSRFWPPGVQKSQFALCIGNRSYNSVRTNVLHYDTTGTERVLFQRAKNALKSTHKQVSTLHLEYFLVALPPCLHSTNLQHPSPDRTLPLILKLVVSPPIII